MSSARVVCVDRLESDGMHIGESSGGEKSQHWISWSELGLAQSVSLGREEAVLQWKLHCVDCDASQRWRHNDREVQLVARSGAVMQPERYHLRSGIMHIPLRLCRGAMIRCMSHGSRVDSMLLGSPLSICLAHRQGNDHGAACLCSEAALDALHHLRKRRCAATALPESPQQYAARWGRIVEFEAASAAVTSDESRTLFNVAIRWESVTGDSGQVVVRGHFDVPFHFAKSHLLKFRGLIRNGGETASGWFCLRQQHQDEDFQRTDAWARHARVVGASIPGHGGSSNYLVIDDDDLEPSLHRKNGIGGLITVTFEVIPDNGCSGLAPTPPKGACFVIEYLPKAISYQVMHIGLSDIDQACRTDGSSEPDLLARDIVLGVAQPLPETDYTDLSVWHMNASQEAAVRAALSRRSHLVHGPAGTGKTRTAAALLGAYVERNRQTRRRAVLFCAPTNRAVDSAVQCMSQLCENAVLLRVYSADSERRDFPLPQRHDSSSRASPHSCISDPLKKFALHFRCHAAGNDDPSTEASETRRAYKRLCNAGPKYPEFDKLRNDYILAYNAARAAEVRRADVIFTTCASVRRNALLEALWKDGAPEIFQVVIDEAAQCVEPEALCPMALCKSAVHIIMFGDHCQLRPTIQSRAAAEAGLDISLFERLSGQQMVSLLQEQYRMHPDLSQFPSDHFYKGLVRNASSCSEHLTGCVLQRHGLDESAPIALLVWDIQDDGACEMRQEVRKAGSGGVGSRSNQLEASHVVKLAQELARVVDESSIAVLSWYNSQVALITDLLREAGLKKLHVGTISTAQGSEWDYVLLSAVCSQRSRRGLGMLSDPHILNVALTRARLGLVILCDRGALERCEHWRALFAHCAKKDLVIRRAPRIVRDKVPRRAKMGGAQADAKILLRHREVHEGPSADELPTANPLKLSDEAFSRRLQHSGKLASYGKAQQEAVARVLPSGRGSNVTVAAHKGVLFGTATARSRKRAWHEAAAEGDDE